MKRHWSWDPDPDIRRKLVLEGAYDSDLENAPSWYIEAREHEKQIRSHPPAPKTPIPRVRPIPEGENVVYNGRLIKVWRYCDPHFVCILYQDKTYGYELITEEELKNGTALQDDSGGRDSACQQDEAS